MRTIYFALLAGLIAAAHPARAHEGDDHGGEPGQAEQAPATATAPRLELTGDGLELVAVAAGHHLLIYLDQAATNEPVEIGGVEISGPGIEPALAMPISPGTYELEAEWVEVPGTKALTFMVTLRGAKTTLKGDLVVEAPAALAPPHAADWRELARRWEVWGVAVAALVLGMLLAMVVRPRRSPPLAGLPGILAFTAALLAFGLTPQQVRAHEEHDHGTAVQAPAGGPRRLANGDVVLPKATQRLIGVRTLVAKSETALKGTGLIGTVIADPSHFGQVQAPMDGRIELSKRGISHVGQRVEVGEELALLAPTIPVADRGTMQQLTAEVQGKLRIAEQKLARLTRIAGVVAQREIDDTRAELDALQEQKRVLAPKDAERIALNAPVSGVISVANVRAGQVVTARDTLFEIVDPAKLWVEAIELSGHNADVIVAAHALDGDGHTLKLSYVGRAPALRQQSLPLQFRIDEAHEALAIGSHVRVVLQRGEPMPGIIVPDAAIVRAPNGLAQVWTKASPELFKAMTVRTVPLDGARVLIIAGLPEGTRVVVSGAELINQVR